MFVRACGFALLLMSLLGQITTAQAPASPVTYTEEQATQGGQVFTRVCVECHARKDFSDAVFRVNWNGRPVFDLFERIRSTMPESGPGSLPRGDYLDVTAYIAKLNNIAAGTVALPDDEAGMKKQTLTLVASIRTRSR